MRPYRERARLVGRLSHLPGGVVSRPLRLVYVEQHLDQGLGLPVQGRELGLVGSGGGAVGVGEAVGREDDAAVVGPGGGAAAFGA